MEELSIDFLTRSGRVRALDRVSLAVEPGEILGLVGESGAGKSLTGMAVLGLLPVNAVVSGGRVLLDGERIDELGERAFRRVRGRRIGAIFQDPMTALDPLMTIGDQLIETITCHLPIGARQARDRAVELLDMTGIPAPEKRLTAYPHEFSGGMRQRVVIALAIAAEPALVIADEPTTALDVSVQAQILDLLRGLCRERGTAVILVTHDMGVVAETADRFAVLYAGGVVEKGPVRSLLTAPCHPYTQGLMAAIPEIGGPAGDLPQIAGSMPRPGHWPEGCRFAPRCRFAECRCATMPPLQEEADGRATACVRTSRFLTESVR